MTRIFVPGTEKFLISGPRKRKRQLAITFLKTLCRIQGLNVVLAEIDSDSHISLITQEYFENYVKPLLFPQNYLAEDPPTFKGFGAFLTSKYPPLKLDFPIGGFILSGRFVVTSELHSSPVLIGSDIIHKYGISLIALTNGKWRIQIGYEPQSMVPGIPKGDELPVQVYTTGGSGPANHHIVQGR